MRTMSKLDILQLGDPALHQLSLRVDARAASTVALVRDLADTLAAFRDERGFGRAIAAPQVGARSRVIVVRVPDGFAAALHNPTIDARSAEMFELWDDCFSFPELMVRVRRHQCVTVSWDDEHGARRRVEAAGDLSELVQHEIDHLDGILATQRAVDPTALCSRAEWQRRYRP
jgi:peptide deformylase